MVLSHWIPLDVFVSSTTFDGVLSVSTVFLVRCASVSLGSTTIHRSGTLSRSFEFSFVSFTFFDWLSWMGWDSWKRVWHFRFFRVTGCDDHGCDGLQGLYRVYDGCLFSFPFALVSSVSFLSFGMERKTRTRMKMECGVSTPIRSKPSIQELFLIPPLGWIHPGVRTVILLFTLPRLCWVPVDPPSNGNESGDVPWFQNRLFPRRMEWNASNGEVFLFQGGWCGSPWVQPSGSLVSSPT